MKEVGKRIWFHHVSSEYDYAYPSQDQHNLWHAELTLKELAYAQKKIGGGFGKEEEERFLYEMWELGEKLALSHESLGGLGHAMIGVGR